MTIEQAHWLAQQCVDTYFHAQSPVVVLPAEVAEDHGWCFIFYYNTRRYLETGNTSHALAPGPGPVVVVKASGDTWLMGSADLEGQLSEYAKRYRYYS